MTVRLNPYLVMNGNAKEAVAFYEKALDAKVVVLQTFADLPPDAHHPVPEALKDRVLHAMLKVGETDLMFSDTNPGMPYQTGNAVTITLTTDDVATTKKFFDALAEGGNVGMPLQQTFWSPAYGQVTDKFQVLWQVTTEVKA